jgi:hypothetical protein
VGAKRPTIFGSMDLTSGYHQGPVSPTSVKYSAFITHMGLFEWLRVPMGLKGAGSYFQAAIATVVLAGLLYINCELYMDDILIYASSDAEFFLRSQL